MKLQTGFVIADPGCYIRWILKRLVSRIEGQVSLLALVRLREGEGFEQAFRRFKKSCEKSGILSEVKKREHYEKPSVRLKKKSISARKRLMKKMKKQHHEG